MQLLNPLNILGMLTVGTDRQVYVCVFMYMYAFYVRTYEAKQFPALQLDLFCTGNACTRVHIAVVPCKSNSPSVTKVELLQISSSSEKVISYQNEVPLHAVAV